MVSIVARYHGIDCRDFQIVCHQDSQCERVTHTRTPKNPLRDSLRFGRIGAIGFPHRGRQMGIPDKSPINSIGWGWARDSGGPPTSASNLPIIFWVLERCFTACFTCRLTDGGNGEPAGLPLGEPTREPKKTPDSKGVLSRVPVAGGKLGVPGKNIWVYPRGLTIPLYCSDSHPSIGTENIFFYLIF